MAALNQLFIDLQHREGDALAVVVQPQLFQLPLSMSDFAYQFFAQGLGVVKVNTHVIVVCLLGYNLHPAVCIKAVRAVAPPAA